MSQQQMESDHSQSSEPASYNTGYRQPPYYNDDSLSSVGHKLTWREEGDLPKDEFRLGLADASSSNGSRRWSYQAGKH